MLQQQAPQDYVIATGEQHSVREFIEVAARMLDMELRWQGSGLDEVALDAQGRTVVAIDPAYFRPTEVSTLLGDPGKARRELGWQPTCTFENLVREMIEADEKSARGDALMRSHGFNSYPVFES